MLQQAVTIVKGFKVVIVAQHKIQIKLSDCLIISQFDTKRMRTPWSDNLSCTTRQKVSCLPSDSPGEKTYVSAQI